jgi:hypothetical protein
MVELFLHVCFSVKEASDSSSDINESLGPSRRKEYGCGTTVLSRDKAQTKGVL